MCLILLAYRAHPDYPLVVAANRDEFFARPTRRAHFWPQHPAVLAGVDQQAGGTWMGVTRQGRFAAVTNFREGVEVPPAPKSRGELTHRFLLGSMPPQQYLRTLDTETGDYAGFNLLIGDVGGLYYFSNRGARPQRLDPGVYGLSNGLLDTLWPKVVSGKRALEAALASASDSEQLLASLMQILADGTQAADHELPDTGIPYEWERLLSSRFIRGSDYGTRSSTALVVNSNRQVRFRERSFDGEEDGSSGTVQGGGTLNFSFPITRP